MSRFFHPREYISRSSRHFPFLGWRPRESCANEKEGGTFRESEKTKIDRYEFGTSSSAGNVLDRYLVVSTCPSLRSTSPCITDAEKNRKEKERKKGEKENERLRCTAPVSYVLARSDFHWSRAISHLLGFDKCDARRDKSAFALTGQIDLETDGKELPTPS